jgi:hypothetical protein
MSLPSAVDWCGKRTSSRRLHGADTEGRGGTRSTLGKRTSANDTNRRRSANDTSHRRRANNTSCSGRDIAGSARSPASGSSYSGGDLIRRGNPGYSTNNPVVRRTRLPLVGTLVPLVIHTKPHQSLNTNPCIIGVLLLINLLPPAITITITSCVVHFVNDIGKLLTCTFVLRIIGIGQDGVTPFGLRSTRRCINHLG